MSAMLQHCNVLQVWWQATLTILTPHDGQGELEFKEEAPNRTRAPG